MKKIKIVTICFIVLTFFSCSKDGIISPQLKSDALLKTKIVYYSLTKNTIPLIYEYQYDDANNLIKESNFEREDKHLTRYFTFEYNNNNQLELKKIFSENFKNNEYEVIVKYEYKYIENQLESMTKYKKNGNSEDEYYIHEIHSYSYKSGNLIEELIDYEQTGSQSKYTFQYDGNGNLIIRTEKLFYSDDISDFRWKYDVNSNKIEEKIYCNNEETQKTIFEYSGINLIRAITYNAGKEMREITYLYDGGGNLIQEKKEIKDPLSNEMPEIILFEYY